MASVVEALGGDEVVEEEAFDIEVPCEGADKTDTVGIDCDADCRAIDHIRTSVAVCLLQSPCAKELLARCVGPT